MFALSPLLEASVPLFFVRENSLKQEREGLRLTPQIWNNLFLNQIMLYTPGAHKWKPVNRRSARAFKSEYFQQNHWHNKVNLVKISIKYKGRFDLFTQAGTSSTTDFANG